MSKWSIARLHKSILGRCYDPNNVLYPKYGAKGITVCDEWKDYETFKKWFKSQEGYKQGQIKRIDPSQGYYSLNCKVEKHRGYTPKNRNEPKTSRLEKEILNQINVGASRKQDSPLWATWVAMRQRCQNPNNSNYHKYGARGIMVCDEWCGAKGFEKFCQWAFSAGWEKGLTIDRIDFNGNYEPDNCRWITRAEQTKNRRSNRYYCYNGQYKLLSEIAEELNLTYSHLYSRVVQKDMTPEQAVEDCLSKGLDKKRRKYRKKNKTKKLKK